MLVRSDKAGYNFQQKSISKNTVSKTSEFQTILKLTISSKQIADKSKQTADQNEQRADKSKQRYVNSKQCQV